MSVACVRASVALSVSISLDTGDPEGPFFVAKGAETDRSCDLAILRSQILLHEPKSLSERGLRGRAKKVEEMGCAK